MLTESGGAGLAPIVALDGHEVSPSEWVVREWFLDGFAPFRDYCAWATGLYANIPQLFGMRAEVTKEACACDGAPACEYRIRWFPEEETATEAYNESRIEMLNARLEALQADGRRPRVRRRPRGRARSASSCRPRARSRRRSSCWRSKRSPTPTSTCTRPGSATTTPSVSRTRSSPSSTTTTSTISWSRCGRSAGATVGSARSTTSDDSSRKSGSCSRRTDDSSRPRSTPPPRSKRPAARRRPPRALLELSNSLAELATADEMAGAHRPGSHRGHRLRPRRGGAVRAERRDRTRRRDARLHERRRGAPALDGGTGRAGQVRQPRRERVGPRSGRRPADAVAC